MYNDLKNLIIGNDERKITVFPKKSARAKKISIRISGHKGIELIIPKKTSLKTATDFLYKNEKWVIDKSKNLLQLEKTIIAIGSVIPVEGKNYTITHSGKIRGITYLTDKNIVVSGPEEFASKKVVSFLKTLAQKKISNIANIKSSKLGVKYSNITIRDTTSRWGSCSANQCLSFSWRLIMAPKYVLEYVVAHEIAHLIEMNHSKAFWQIVEEIFPEHLHARNWLKKQGNTLHFYQQQ